ncbi:uncharacterized protein LOC131858553 [Cryptomeria japonica]|uniref:uncharacterized protein LOC131858553 n=1 Tax=Cryptomeria japonica TaxID=3369 RepID=UPI0027DA1131|nr:uncharacterized protein LOC131858553 [Cryptomeria japonica]
MEQVIAEQQMVALPSTTIMAEAPPCVSTIVATSAPSTVVSKEASTTTTTAPSTKTPLVTTTLIPTIPSTIAATSSQNVPQKPVVIQKEATTPSTNTKLPPWMDMVAPKRKKHVISPDEFDFEQLAPSKFKGTKKPKIVSRVLVDPTIKRKYAETLATKVEDDLIMAGKIRKDANKIKVVPFFEPSTPGTMDLMIQKLANDLLALKKKVPQNMYCTPYKDIPRGSYPNPAPNYAIKNQAKLPPPPERLVLKAPPPNALVGVTEGI